MDKVKRKYTSYEYATCQIQGCVLYRTVVEEEFSNPHLCSNSIRNLFLDKLIGRILTTPASGTFTCQTGNQFTSSSKSAIVANTNMVHWSIFGTKGVCFCQFWFAKICHNW